VPPAPVVPALLPPAPVVPATPVVPLLPALPVVPPRPALPVDPELPPFPVALPFELEQALATRPPTASTPISCRNFVVIVAPLFLVEPRCSRREARQQIPGHFAIDHLREFRKHLRCRDPARLTDATTRGTGSRFSDRRRRVNQQDVVSAGQDCIVGGLDGAFPE